MFISEDQFTEEAMTYTSDPNLAKLDTSVDFDVFWGTLTDERKYPLLVLLAKTLVSGFHGPLVEGSFSTMSNVMDPQTGRMDVKTCAAIQTVRYCTKQKGGAKAIFAK